MTGARETARANGRIMALRPGPRLIGLFCLAQVLSLAGFGSFPALLPGFVDLWRLSSTEAGWINGIYFGAYMLAVPVLVSLTDRVDARAIYIFSALAAALAALGFALLAEGFWTALGFRALAGASLAGTYMPGLKALNDRLSAETRSRGVAFYTASFSIGVALSFLLTGQLDAWLGWRWTFASTALGPLLAIGLFLGFAGPASQAAAQRPEGALLDFRPVLRNRRALGYVLAYWAHNWELFAFRSWLVAFLVFAQARAPEGGLGQDWSPTAIATLVILVGLPASVLGNETAERLGRRRLVTLVMLASAVLAGLFGFAAGLPVALVVAVALLYSLTVSADSASITAGAIGAAAPERQGATMALHSLVGFSGAFLGPLVFGVVLDLGGGPERALAWGLAFVSSGLAVASGPLALALLGREAGSADKGSA